MAKSLYEVLPSGKFRLNLHPGQTRAWESQARFIFVLAGSQGGKCVIIGTMILMSDGSYKPIEDVRAGDTVMSLGADLKITENRVSASFSTGVQPVYRITTSSGRSVVVTAEHPLYGVNGWTPAGNFKPNDWIAVPRNYRFSGGATADAKRMRLLGYLLGDGGLTRTSPIFTKADPEILADIQQCLPESYGLTHVSRYDYRITNGQGRGQRKSSNGQFASGSNAVIELCKEWGIWGKLSKEKRMPEFVFHLDNLSLANVLCTLYSCDGTVSNKDIEIVLASEGLIDDLQKLLLRFGIVSRKSYKPVNAPNGITYKSWRLEFSDLLSLQTWANEIGLVGPKSRKLAEVIARKLTLRPNSKDLIPNFPTGECMAKMGKRGYKKPWADQSGYELLRSTRRGNVSRAFAQKLADHFGVGGDIAYSDIYWDTVRSVEPLGDQPVWDITVENGHNFIAEDIFCHNTSFGPWWLWREIVRCGGGDFIAATSNYDLFKLKMLPEALRVFEDTLKIGRYWAGDKVIELKNPATGKFMAKRAMDPMWARIILRSAGAKAGLESLTAKAAWLDEVGQDEFPVEAWEAILRRLALAQGRVLGTTTPYNLGWVKQQVYDPWLAGDKDFEVIQFASILNPVYPLAEYERAQRSMPLWKFLMFYRGEFARPPGLIYSDYEEDMHKIAPFPIPSHWPRYVGIDPGGTNLATVWIAENPATKVYYLYRESLEGGITTDEHVNRAKERAQSENVVTWTGGAQSESQFRRDWASRGISVKEPKIWEVWSGIDNVITLFKTKRLFVFDACAGTRSQLGTYSRVLDKKTLEPTDEIKDKNSFHYLDALRYAGTRLDAGQWSDSDASKLPNVWDTSKDVPSPAKVWWDN